MSLTMVFPASTFCMRTICPVMLYTAISVGSYNITFKRSDIAAVVNK